MLKRQSINTIKVAMVGDFPLVASRIDGGVQAATKYLVDGLLATEAIDLHLLTFSSAVSRASTQRTGNLTRYILPRQRLGALSRWRVDFRTLNRCLQEIDPDVVHGQGAGVEGFLSVNAGFPSVITFHGIMTADAKFKSHWIDRWRLGLQSRITERACATLCDHAILISPYVEQVFGDQLKGAKHHIPNAIADHFYLTERNEQPGRILFAGRLIPIKGIIELIQAFAIVRERSPCELFLAGSMSDELYVRTLKDHVAKLGLSNQVHFLGLLEEDRLLEEFSRASVLALPSFQENAPMVIEQAMAAGVPVVASSVGGIPFMVEHGRTGLLAGAGNVRELAEMLSRLLREDHLRYDIGDRAQYSARSYSARAVAEQTIEVYRLASLNKD